MLIAELSGRRRQAPSVLGEEGQSLGTQDILSIAPVYTHVTEAMFILHKFSQICTCLISSP